MIGGQELFQDRWDSEQRLPSLGIRKAWFYLVLPLGGTLISFLAIGKIIAVMRARTDKEESA